MPRRPLIFAIITAMFIPLSLLVILAVNPYGPPFSQGLLFVFDRLKERPIDFLFLAAWMLFFGLLGLACSALSTRLQRARRAAKHLCPTCGYDMRATPTQCPECGTLVKK